MEPYPIRDYLGSPGYPPLFDSGGPPLSESDDVPRPAIGDLSYEPRRWTSHRKPQFVWPKDKHRSFGGRLKDVLRGDGPDIFITRRGDLGPHRSIWSGWDQYGLTSNINQYGRMTTPALWTEQNHYGERNSAMPLLKSAERRFRGGQVYDFQRRKYGSRARALWSDAHRSRQNPRRVLFTRDRRGFETDHGGFPEVELHFGGVGRRRHGGWIWPHGRDNDDDEVHPAFFNRIGTGGRFGRSDAEDWRDNHLWRPEDSSLDGYHRSW